MTDRPKRRGRPPINAEARKRHNVTFRVRDSLKSRLENEATTSGRSVSEVVESRLERSFADEAVWGGPEMLSMAHLMIGAFTRGGQLGAHARKHPKWSPAQWINDPLCFEVAIASVIEALKAAQPLEDGSSYPDERVRNLAAKIRSIFGPAIARGAEITYEDGDGK